jgi:hypothetical protein
MPTSTNILIGPATFSIGDYPAAGNPPVNTPSYVDVGHTKGPTEYAPNFSDYEVKSEQAYGVVKKVPLEAAFTVKVPILEATVTHLRYAFRNPSTQVTGTPPNVTFAITKPSEQYHSIRLAGPGLGTNKIRTVYFWKCIVTEVAPISVAKADTQSFQITFTVLYDDSVSTANGEFAKSIDS